MTDITALAAAYSDDRGSMSAYSAQQFLDHAARDYQAGLAAERAAATAAAERSALTVLEQYKGMTREGAAEKLAALNADKEYMARYLNGSAAERREMDLLTEIKISGPSSVDTLMAGTAPSTGYAAPGIPNRDVMAWIEQDRVLGVSDDVQRHTLENRQVTAAEHRAAKLARAQLENHREFMKQFDAGDPTARRIMNDVLRIIVSPIADAA